LHAVGPNKAVCAVSVYHHDGNEERQHVPGEHQIATSTTDVNCIASENLLCVFGLTRANFLDVSSQARIVWAILCVVNKQYVSVSMLFQSLRDSIRNSCTNAKLRWPYEKQLLKSQKYSLLAYLIILSYFATIVFRNVGFYRYEPGPRLRDIGFDIVADLENNEVMEMLYNLPIVVGLLGMLFCLLVSLFYGNRDTPYVTNMLKRVFAVLAIGHTLRFISYSVTVIPGKKRK
jgi:hypothetical protein